jgi:hypothetical protein
MASHARLALAGAGCLGLVLVGCGDDPGTGSGGGDLAVVEAVGTVEGTTSTVQLPTGQVELQVAEPGPIDEGAVPGDAEVDGDATYVGVSWDFVPGAGVPGTLGGFLLAEDVPSEVSVRLGEETATLGATYSSPGGEAAPTSVFVEVGDATLGELDLLVEFDGVTQSVSADGSGALEAGAAEPLYDLPQESTPADCAPEVTPASVRAEPACSVASVQLPYLTGEGWAPDGQTWTVVDVSTRLDRVVVGGDEERVTALEGTDTLDGDPADAVLLEDGGFEGTLHTQTGYLSDEGDPLSLVVERSVTLAEGPGDVALRAEVPLR